MVNNLIQIDHKGREAELESKFKTTVEEVHNDKVKLVVSYRTRYEIHISGRKYYVRFFVGM